MTKLLASISGITGLALIALVILAVYGWVMNLITVVSSYDTMSVVELCLRVVGIVVAILGALMHYLA